MNPLSEILKKSLPIVLLIVLLIFNNASAFIFYNDIKYPVKIVLPASPTEFEKHAADVLQDYLFRITGCKPNIIDDTAPLGSSEIIIGNNKHLWYLKWNLDLSLIDKDGFLVSTRGNYLLIAGGAKRGIIYGVYAFLEKYCGCRKYSADCKVIPKRDTIVVRSEEHTSELQSRFAIRMPSSA